MNRTILIVDDDEEIQTQMKWALGGEYEVMAAEDRPTALQQFRVGRPVVTLLDLGLPPRPNDPDEGMATLAGIFNIDRSAKVIIVSGQEERDNALRAVGAGAHDFHCKPVDTGELRLLLQRCIYVADLERENRQRQGQERKTVFEGMLGACPGMRAVFTAVRKLATTDAPVLITGEAGAGKNTVARAIHRRSPLRNRPFVTVNCDAIPAGLLESELFGEENGSTAAAGRSREGLLERAAGGTLLLDEVGSVPLPLQVKIRRLLQDKCMRRVGGGEDLKVEARIMAATTADLEAAVHEGTFREDLYLHLAVVVCELPPLRERGEDAVLLAQDFLGVFAAHGGNQGLEFAPQTLDAIRRAPWSGNVRELQNRVQRAVIMSERGRVSVEDMGLEDADGREAIPTLREARREFEREMVEETLRRHGDQITSTAAALGISRPTLYEMLDKLGIPRKRPNSR